MPWLNKCIMTHKLCDPFNLDCYIVQIQLGETIIPIQKCIHSFALSFTLVLNTIVPNLKPFAGKRCFKCKLRVVHVHVGHSNLSIIVASSGYIEPTENTKQ